MSTRFKEGVNDGIIRLFNGIGNITERVLDDGAPVVLSFIGKAINVLFSVIGAILAWIWDTVYEFVELIILSYHACFGYGRYRLRFRRLGSVIAGFTSIAAFIGTIIFHGFSFTCVRYLLLSMGTNDANQFSYYVQNWDEYNKAWEVKNAFIANSKIASFLSSLNDNVGEKLLQGLLLVLGCAAFLGLIVLICYCFYKAFTWNAVIAERKAAAAEKRAKQKEWEARKRRASFKMVSDVINLDDYRAVK